MVWPPETLPARLLTDVLSLFPLSGATWCGPCKMISPLFEKFAAEAPADKIAFYKVDVDEQEQISQEVGIKAMPTFVFFKKGEKVTEVVGAVPQKLQVSRESEHEGQGSRSDSAFPSGCHQGRLCLSIVSSSAL